jgi:large subunit ribosomal protein L21
MYAVIQTGGKQYRVQPGEIVQIEKLEGDVGSTLSFGEVLFLSKGDQTAAQISLGKPLIAGAKVEGEIVGQGRGDKVLIVKMKRRKQYRRTQGHRQYQTQVLITKVDGATFGNATLDAAKKQELVGAFNTQLKPMGLGHTPKTLGSRKRRTSGLLSTEAAAGTTKAAPKKAPAKKASAK